MYKTYYDEWTSIMLTESLSVFLYNNQVPKEVVINYLRNKLSNSY